MACRPCPSKVLRRSHGSTHLRSSDRVLWTLPLPRTRSVPSGTKSRETLLHRNQRARSKDLCSTTLSPVWYQIYTRPTYADLVVTARKNVCSCSVCFSKVLLLEVPSPATHQTPRRRKTPQRPHYLLDPLLKHIPPHLFACFLCPHHKWPQR